MKWDGSRDCGIGGVEGAEESLSEISELDSRVVAALDDGAGGGGGGGEREVDCLEDDVPKSEPMAVRGSGGFGASGQMSGILSILS